MKHRKPGVSKDQKQNLQCKYNTQSTGNAFSFHIYIYLAFFLVLSIALFSSPSFNFPSLKREMMLIVLCQSAPSVVISRSANVITVVWSHFWPPDRLLLCSDSFCLADLLLVVTCVAIFSTCERFCVRLWHCS